MEFAEAVIANWKDGRRKYNGKRRADPPAGQDTHCRSRLRALFTMTHDITIRGRSPVFIPIRVRVVPQRIRLIATSYDVPMSNRTPSENAPGFHDRKLSVPEAPGDMLAQAEHAKPTCSSEGSNVYRYLISGLVVHSEVKLAAAIPLAAAVQTPDIMIQSNSIAPHLDAPLRCGDTWQAESGRFLLRVPGIARFLVENGHSILFDLDPLCDTRTVALYLLGTCFAILLQQRGNLVLHASAIAVGDRAMLFCGQSGAGKSTMAALLCRRGYGLLNDDVCNLIPAAHGTYEVRPDGRMLKLWSESLDRLAWDKPQDMKVRADIEKFFCAPPLTAGVSKPVGAIYILRATPAGGPPSIRRLRAMEGMIELKRNAYRRFLVAAMDMEAAYFKASAALQQSAGIYVLSRPLDFAATDSLLDLLEDHWKRCPAPLL